MRVDGTSAMHAVELCVRNPSMLPKVKERLGQKPIAASRVRVLESPSNLAGTFNELEFFSKLQTRHLGAILLRSGKLGSTSDFLLKEFESFPSGTVCVSDEQTAGQGRGTNVWQSPYGCLTFSFTCETSLAAAEIPLLQYISTLAVVKAIEESCTAAGCSQYKSLGIRIKWPNDIYYKLNKIGGVLCKAIYRENSFSVVIGIGLNLDNSSPSVCLNSLINENALFFSTFDGTKRGGVQEPSTEKFSVKLKREALVPKILAHFESLHDKLQRNGFCAIRV